MRVIELENQIAERLRAMPDLVAAEIVGPWVTAGPAQSRSLDLLLVVDVADEQALLAWRQDQLAEAFADLEQDLLCPIEVLAFTKRRFSAEARRGAAVLAAIYSRPRMPLVSSLESLLDAETVATLAGRALSLEEYTYGLDMPGSPALA